MSARCGAVFNAFAEGEWNLSKIALFGAHRREMAMYSIFYIIGVVVVVLFVLSLLG